MLQFGWERTQDNANDSEIEMADIEKLDEKRSRDRLTAHLGLAAGETGEVGEAGEGCLTREELASMAANVCTPEEREKALAHFSVCQRCYNDWVALCFSLAAMERGSGRMPLMTVRNLAYVGSALAIAACVVLFFNINRDVDLLQVGPGTPRVEQRTLESAAPQPTQQPEKEQEEGEPSRSNEIEKMKMETTRGEDQHEDPAAAPTAGGMSAARTATTLPYVSWLRLVEENCQGGNVNPAFWQMLLGEGQRIAAAGAEEPLLASLLAMMATMEDAEQVERQCSSILTLLAEQGGTK